MITVRNLSRRYGDFIAVDQVSFNIGQGEIVGLLGHNGAGKTTIMKMLTGYLEPTEGEIEIDGVNVQAAPLAVQANLGYLPESLPLYPELTVADYLTHAAQLRGADAKVAVPEAIAATGLQDKAFDRIETLSRGYKQRLGVAQAILHKPRILILDEPSNGLDPTQIRDMRALIQSLAQQATVILSTHIMQEVNAICDRALILRNGQLAVDERLDALRQSSRVRVRTSNAADLSSTLAGQESLGDVTRQTDGEWLISISDDQDSALAVISSAITQAGLPLYHLAVEVRDLESVFAEVSAGEDRHAA